MANNAALERQLEAAELAENFNVELIPGTEVMTDLSGVHFVRYQGRVLVPQPQNHKNDPLNFSHPWKFATVGGWLLITIVNALGPMAISPQIPVYMAEWDRSLDDILQFIGVCILVLGFSNFIWVPLGNRYGRRPATIASSLIGLASAIWRARAQSYNSFLGACALQGIAAGPDETYPGMIIADVMFLHERGRYMGIYMWSYMSSLMVGPTIAGVMTDRYGWRSFWWLNVAMYSIFALYSIFLLPETKWNRNQEPKGGEPSETIERVSVEQVEKPTNAHAESNEEHKEAGVTHLDHLDKYVYKGGPSRDQMKLVSPTALGYDNEIVNTFVVPFKLFMFPIVQWAGFVFSFATACFLQLNLTQSQVFSAPPYNFDATKVGYLNFGLFVGATIGLLTSGPLSDWISMRATIRNGGIREPEMRLPALIPYTICLIAGTLVTVYGYGKWKWEIVVIIGYALVGIQVASIPTIALTYAVDCYKPAAGNVLLNVTINKNLWGYGVSKFLTPWIAKSGYGPPMFTLMGLTVLWLVLAVPLYFYGKTVRRWSRDSSVHRL